MKRLPVRVSASVLEQIEKQATYIATDSVQNAIRWELRVRTAIEALADFHAHAFDVDVSAQVGHPVRKLVFERTYLLHYFVDESQGVVRVVRFRHGARALEDLTE